MIIKNLKNVPFNSIGHHLDNVRYEKLNKTAIKLDNNAIDSISLDETKLLISFLFLASLSMATLEQNQAFSHTSKHPFDGPYYYDLINGTNEIRQLRNKYLPNQNLGQIVEGLEVKLDAQNSDCFIATVIYQDICHPKITLLRKYRNQVLYQSAWGRIFVRVYYFIGPGLAKIINRIHFLKTLFQMILDWFVLRIENKYHHNH